MLKYSRTVFAVVIAAVLLTVTAAFAQKTFETAGELPLNECTTFTVEPVSAEYWWKVTTTSVGNLILFTKVSDSIEYNMYIFDAKNCEIAKRINAGSQADIKIENLAEGTCFILIERTGGSGECTLSNEFKGSSGGE